MQPGNRAGRLAAFGCQKEQVDGHQEGGRSLDLAVVLVVEVLVGVLVGG